MQAEKAVEKYLCECIKDKGGFCIKQYGVNGIPDRLCILPEGKFAFCELKAPGGRLSAIQEVRHRQLKKLGFPVFVLWNFEHVDNFIKYLEATK